MTTETFTLGPNPSIEIEHVGGDVTLEGWDKKEVQVQGDDIHIEHSDSSLNLLCDSDLKLTLPRTIKLTVSYVGGDMKAENLEGPLEISFVGGDVILRNLKGPVALSGMIGGDTKFENVSQVSMDANRSGGGPDISAQVRRKVEQATRRAEQKVRRAENKIKIVERRFQHNTRVNAHVDTRRWKWNINPASFTPGEVNEPVSDEERMTILKMLQEKKITSEQADKLLSALDGGE
jgi:hypothetical protein